MANDAETAAKLAYSSRCVPGSQAEIAEKERLAEFQRNKVARKAAEAQAKPEQDAKRQEEYITATEAIKERMSRSRSARR